MPVCHEQGNIPGPSPGPVDILPHRANCSMGGTCGPICQLQRAWLRLREKTLPKSHHFKQKDPAWRNSTCLENCWGKTATTKLCGELSWQSQEHQRGSRPSCCPLGTSFLPYPTSSPRLERHCRKQHPSCKISSLILLSAGAKPPQLQLRFGEGRKRLQQLNWWGERKTFSSCLRTAAHFKGQEFVWVSLQCSPSLGRRNSSS